MIFQTRYQNRKENGVGVGDMLIKFIFVSPLFAMNLLEDKFKDNVGERQL